ncbi:hypothetical protein O181_008233 [Austropuccinia psidii MF-1]|uniref:Integrase zinc-binding domain-containing protein n=1 Tax=Austropuccinia psidii MF-1 TaxID=1389203 RepID=A0A9Q3GIB4_9BASI|nr:hypothetical protein [Austropuccinia psidii MF-1]
MIEERVKEYGELKNALTNSPFLLMKDWKLTFKLYIYAFGESLGAALNQTQIINDKPVEGPICFISRQIKPTKARYGESQMECHWLVWALGKLHYYLDGTVFDVITDCNAVTYGISSWALSNTPETPEWVAQEEHHIEGICVTDIGTEFFNKAKESYKMDKKCHILCQILVKDCKEPSLSSKLDEIWKKAYDEGRSHLLDGILYHRTKHTCVMTLTDRTFINTIFNEFHDSVSSGHLSEDRTLDRYKTCSWWPTWRKDVAEYCQTCDRCQKENRATEKKFGMMIQIQEPKSPWEIVHMDWVTALPPG